MTDTSSMLAAGVLSVVVVGLGAALWLAQRQRTRLTRERDAARKLSESANDAVVLADVVEGRLLDANPAACALLGRSREQLLGLRLPDLHPASERARSAMVIDYHDQSAVLLLARDIRERLEAERRIRKYATELEAANRDLKEMQAQLVRSEQMASLGNLAAGIAHEINNPIGSVNANVDTGRRAIDVLRACLADEAQPVDRRKVERALQALAATCESTAQAGQRIAGIVRSLRNFARLDEAERKRVDLREGIESALVLLQHRLSDRIVVERDYAPDLPQIECSPGQLNQAFMQVLLNAVEAVDSKGTITIRARMNGDDRLHISFQDNGCGIAPEHLPNVFDPGFTTKGAGVGAGLGLAIVYRIVDEHGGHIELDSTPGTGTTVAIELPR